MDARRKRTIQKKSAELKKEAIFFTTWAVFHPDRIFDGTQNLASFAPH